ncbi:SRPBCC family protein [Chelativorans sp. YIM 93263]|uniref:SRPBCC family protein n=1 Tax=Chelativorans sp. YIM 93263 TaxID=2906648 RepID=UPI0023785442|nr:SRPBCC family protein [Chelativorans sp. YIM 93263]
MTGKTITARVTHRFTASPERVFDAWLDPEKIRVWMRMALQDFGLPGDIRRVEVDPRVGGGFTFSDMRSGGEAVHWGTYREIDRPRKLVFTWFTSAKDEKENSSVVTLTITPDGEGCHASISHEIDAALADYLEPTKKGWSTMLAQSDLLLSQEQ